MRRGLAIVLGVAACSSAASNPQPTTATEDTVALLGSMATLVGVVADPPHLTKWARKIDGGQVPLASYIDELLASDRFAREVVPALVFGAYVNVRNYYALPSAFVLKRSPETNAPLYLRAPCTSTEAVTVHPWWDLGTEVRVCPDAYRPEKWSMAAHEHTYRTRSVLTCDSQIGSPELETSSLCGCGPNLIRCLRDEQQYSEFTASLMNEVKQTTAYVVQHDLPMASLFTESATFRDRNVELYYRRQKINALEIKDVEPELADLDAWPRDGKWAIRDEVSAGQHAGLLTSPQILHWLPDRRQRQRAYYEMLWCNLRNSFGATTHKVLELNTGNNSFVTDSWQKLAHTELCTNCHARLDYGFQFFMGYPDSRASTHFNPALASTASGPLYGTDLADHRGEAPLTPIGFAKLATAQPDFKACMASHFVSYVLGERATADDLRAIEAAVEHTGTFKPPMKIALERYAEHHRQEARAAKTEAPAKAAPARKGAKGSVVVSSALRTKLDALCTDCHDEVPYTDNPDADDQPYDLRGGELPRALVVQMTDQVAFGMMPKDQTLAARAREDLVRLLIGTLWTDPAARTEAERYYLGRSRGLPAHQLDNAIHAIDRLAGARSDIKWGAIERAIWSDQATITPGFLAVTGLEALRACARSAEGEGAQLDACLLRATAVHALSRWTPPAHPR
ncbi:MAG: hypothetical protein H0T89_25115 [Deltaproteobacteria bacterium]|nr:hypothetical protein [Deltaproteobacteria bacterium]MDQ3299325.1 hypothetical protein [Myxococcota bacterium]